jgi:hypothetical protein
MYMIRVPYNKKNTKQNNFIIPKMVKVKSLRGPVTEISYVRWQEISRQYPGIFTIVQQ